MGEDLRLHYRVTAKLMKQLNYLVKAIQPMLEGSNFRLQQL